MHCNLNFGYRLARVSGSNAAKVSRSPRWPHGMADSISSVNCLASHQDVVLVNEDSAGLATWVARPAESFFVASSPLSVAESAFSKGRQRRKRRGTEPHLPFLSDSAESGERSIGFRAVAEPSSD